MQVGKDLRKALIQPSTQRRVRGEIRLVCSEPFPLGIMGSPILY